MKVGFCGLGKLGLPVALAVESRGHEIHGFDVSDAPYNYLASHAIPYQEEGLQPLLDNHSIQMHKSIGEVVANSEVVFLAIQTPHSEKYEGVTRLPDDRQDFDYTYLKEAVSVVADVCKAQKAARTIVAISTCLPGTFSREIKPLLNEYTNYAYSPQFIAMGTVLQDYLHPEFNLVGVESEEAADQLERFYATINDAPNVRTDITTAEGIKVFYNTFITAKTLLANSWMQVAHKMGMNVDDITDAMAISTRRLLSSRYLRGGGPDSGGCHPRDLIALSWLGEEIDMKPNWFEMMANARELQTEWTADLLAAASKEYSLPVIIMGKSFKPETNITTGSGALLLRNILSETGIVAYAYDPKIDGPERVPKVPAVYFIATNHKEFSGWQYPPNSVIIDLWRNVEPPEDCLYIPVGNPDAIQDNRSPAGLLERVSSEKTGTPPKVT
jgi:UDPglucose 6-dehydrogenase